VGLADFGLESVDGSHRVTEHILRHNHEKVLVFVAGTEHPHGRDEARYASTIGPVSKLPKGAIFQYVNDQYFVVWVYPEVRGTDATPERLIRKYRIATDACAGRQNGC